MLPLIRPLYMNIKKEATELNRLGFLKIDYFPASPSDRLIPTM